METIIEKNKIVRVSLLGGKETSAYHDGTEWITVERAMLGSRHQVITGWATSQRAKADNKVPFSEILANALRQHHHLDLILWGQAILTVIVGTLI